MAHPTHSTKERARTGAVVTGVIGSDCHIVGNWILVYALKQAGFTVASLGTACSQKEFTDAAVEIAADAILVSSIYGHAYVDCEGLREKCIEAGLGNILLYIGGNLVVGREDWATIEKRFLDLGFDRVYPPQVQLDEAIKQLQADIELKRAGPMKSN